MADGNTEITPEIKAHPSYSEGYWDGLEGEPREEAEPDEYYIGYSAGERAAQLFADAGFEKIGDGSFHLDLTIDPARASILISDEDDGLSEREKNHG